MIKLMLVEDEDIIRKGIRDLIGRAAPDFEVVCEAAHGKEALAYLERNVVDAIITDIRMREMDGLQMVEKLRAAGHRCRSSLSAATEILFMRKRRCNSGSPIIC